jgi:type II secretory pathway pseudopilin PulG
MWNGNSSRARASRGLTYLGLLLTIAIVSAVLASAGVVWHTQAQREREQELLFVGGEIRKAIGRFYNNGGARQYPQTLDELLRDPRDPGVVRHLRKLYHDPIIGGSEWGLVRGPGDRIMGVYSPSDEQPIRQANFEPADAAFEGREKYSEWQFIYIPKTTRRPPAAVRGPGVGGASPLLPGSKP